MTHPPAHTGAMLAQMLADFGVERIFSVPGESFLAFLDGLVDTPIELVTCRHEGGAAMMAEAEGKMTGRPGVAVVTRGPGATNAAAGVHVARHDSTAMLLLIGQVARTDRDRDAFQEVDFRALFAPLAKAVFEIDDPARLPEYIARAYHLAQTGRPGPVVVSLPEDMLAAPCPAAPLPCPAIGRAGACTADLDALTDRIAQAKRPLIVAGGSLWSHQASQHLADLATRWALPVAVAFRRQDYMDNRHPAYCGDIGVGMNPALGHALGHEADLILALGTRLGDTATGGYSLLDPGAAHPALVMVHPDPDLPARLWHPELALCADPREVLAALAARPHDAPPQDERLAWQADLRVRYTSWQAPRPTPGRVRMEEVVGFLSETLPDDAIITNGAGNYAAFLHRYFRFKTYGTQLAPTSGSMGYGIPAAIAASLRYPERVVIAMAGDGCAQMTVNELSTAAQHGARPIVIVANNGQYGTIRMHQERSFPCRISGTALANPDYAALARAYGGFGVAVRQSADFPAAFAAARASGSFAVIELQLDPEALSAGASLSELRQSVRSAQN